MLPKQSRLNRKDLEVFFRGKTRFYKGSMLNLKIHKSANSKVQWAFVVSSDIKKNAVARNKTRRRMNDIAFKLQSSIIGGWDLVFMLRLQKKQPPSFKVLQDDMIQTLKQCGALSE